MVGFTAKIIKESGLNLSRSVTSYFELNDLINGRLRLKYSRVHIYELINNVIKECKCLALERDISLSVSYDKASFNLSVNTDPVKFKRFFELIIFEIISLLDKWSSIRIELDVDSEKKFYIINLDFYNLSIDFSKIALFEKFWGDELYDFKLQEGPGVVLEAARKLLIFLGGSAQYVINEPSSGGRLIIKFPV